MNTDSKANDSPYLLDSVESSSVSADTGADDEQVVIERLRWASVTGNRGRRDDDASSASRRGEADSVRIGALSERREPQGLSPEAAETEVYRLG
jgi:hypothetical protein